MATVISIKKYHDDLAEVKQLCDDKVKLIKRTHEDVVTVKDGKIRELMLENQRLTTKYEDLFVKYQRMLRRHWWQFWKPNN